MWVMNVVTFLALNARTLKCSFNCDLDIVEPEQQQHLAHWKRHAAHVAWLPVAEGGPDPLPRRPIGCRGRQSKWNGRGPHFSEGEVGPPLLPSEWSVLAVNQHSPLWLVTDTLGGVAAFVVFVHSPDDIFKNLRCCEQGSGLAFVRFLQRVPAKRRRLFLVWPCRGDPVSVFFKGTCYRLLCCCISA